MYIYIEREREREREREKERDRENDKEKKQTSLISLARGCSRSDPSNADGTLNWENGGGGKTHQSNSERNGRAVAAIVR